MAKINQVATKPIEGQKPGTSGLRKKVEVFSQENYLANFVQAIFDTQKVKTLVLGGDGRYFSGPAVKTIIRLAVGNGIEKLYLGKDFLLATPAAACEITTRKADGGIILTASHNPGGPKGDFGVKFNIATGGPAPSSVTNAIFERTKTISELNLAEIDFAPIDFTRCGKHTVGDFELHIFDPTENYVNMLKGIFDFDAIKKLGERDDFSFLFDALHGVAGAYAQRIFLQELGFPKDSLVNCVPKEDFGGGHPDPNLTYAHELVDRMGLGHKTPDKIPTFGAACDGDMDRNMVVGTQFFVSPCDSLAVICDKGNEAIPFFRKNPIQGVARSMPTSAAVDVVAQKKGLNAFEVPTGWKFFGNLISAKKISLCGEESFGTGSSHVLEKDGIWAVLAWLSILAYENENSDELITVADIVQSHWKKYGRNFFTRYDYETVGTQGALDMMAGLIAKFDNPPKFKVATDTEAAVKTADEFEYKDPVDGSVASNQGVRFQLEDGSRVIFRLSGTGSSGATIRMYIDRYEADRNKCTVESATALAPLIESAVSIARIKELTGRDKPTVIT